MNHGPAGLDCLVCRFYWSTGAAVGLIMKDSGTNLRGEVPKKVIFVCDSCCGQTVDLDREEGAGGSTTARSLSCACSFAMSLSARSLPRSGERERKSNVEKAAEEICSSGRPLFVCFFAPLQDVGLLETSCFSSMVSSISGTSSERFLTITFRISSVKYGVYFLVVCLFFLRSRIDFQKRLDEKHKKQPSCPNFAQFTNFTKISRVRKFVVLQYALPSGCGRSTCRTELFGEVPEDASMLHMKSTADDPRVLTVTLSSCKRIAIECHA